MECLVSQGRGRMSLVPCPFWGGAVGCLGIRVSRGKVSMGSRIWGDMISGGGVTISPNHKSGRYVSYWNAFLL